MELSFSIVIPNYNSGEVIERAICSLISQNYPHLQLIVADAGSNDSSRDIIQRYRNYFDTVITEKDHGQADGLNKGFSYARGDVFGWLCADDVLLPGALDHVADIFMKKPNADVVTGGCERVFEDGSTFITRADPDAFNKIGIQNLIEQPSTFWRAGLHRKIGPLDLGYYLGFDWDFWARMKNSHAHLATTDKVLSRYFFSNSNKCGRAGNLFAEEAFRLIRKYGPFFGALAYIYRFMYRHFDLKGCIDNPPACPKPRYLLYRMVRMMLRGLIGKTYLNMYNWHFASCQSRNLKWY
jgi:glycosyltransferase involved in cell wall biosynthesis